MVKKKYIFLGLLFSMMLVLSACSGNQETTAPENEVTTEAPNNIIMVSGDTVSKNNGCVLSSRYAVGDKIIFRMNALDPETNKQIEDAKLQVHLSTGDVLDMAYGNHGEDNFWVVAYEVTEDTPTGALDYTVTAELGDRKGEYKPFNVKPSLLMIVDAAAVSGESEEQPAEESAEKPS